METSDILKIKTPDLSFFPFDSWNEKQRLGNFSSRNHLLLHKVNGFTENEKLWYFHPIAFVQHLKRLFASTFPFEKPNRAVHSVFLHCSASDLPEHDSVDVIEDWHKQRGWDGIGYHYFIKKDGTIQVGRDLEKIPIAQSGHNTGSIAICLHGLKKEKFTNDQYNSVVSVCSAIRGQYMPQKIKFRGHCEVSSKTCPVFDYKKVLDLDVNGYMK